MTPDFSSEKAKNIEKRWYALRAISGKEQKVRELLEAEIKNTDMGNYVFRVLIPTEKVYTTRNGKKTIKERPLMSGYVFVEAKLTGEVEFELRTTTNVIDFVRTREKNPRPEPVRDSEIMRLLKSVDEQNERGEDEENDYIVGEAIKVTNGPFNGFEGKIEEVNRERRTLKVMVKVFGRETPLELDNSQVERV